MVVRCTSFNSHNLSTNSKLPTVFLPHLNVHRTLSVIDTPTNTHSPTHHHTHTHTHTQVVWSCWWDSFSLSRSSSTLCPSRSRPSYSQSYLWWHSRYEHGTSWWSWPRSSLSSFISSLSLSSRIILVRVVNTYACNSSNCVSGNILSGCYKLIF